jgi:TonB family protein
MAKLLLAFSVIGSFLVVVPSKGDNRSMANSQQEAQATGTSPELSEAMRLNESVAELYKQGKYDEALPLARRVLEIEKKTLGSFDPRIASALNNLAEIYVAKRMSRDAEALFEQAIAIYENEPESNSPLIGQMLERLASIRFDKGDYEKAATLLVRSIAVKEKLVGKEDLKLSDSLWALASVRRVEQRYDLARPLFLRALNVKEHKLGPSNPSTVEAMKTFACVDMINSDRRLVPGEKPRGPERSDEERALIGRAVCWLYGFREDCDKSFGKSPIKREDVGVLNGKAINLAQPPYPVAARSKHLSGTVFIAVLIDEEGKVVNAKPICGGYSEFNAVGVEAARASKFRPVKLNDQAVQVTGMIVYRFIAQ